ncbi:MAG TPA: heavy metal-binding domain-containing protein [Pyrinomonadaceae bacterium]
MARVFRLMLLSICLGLAFVQASPAQARQQTKYVCPMHADVTSSRQGSRCPRCNMKLVAASSGKAATGRRKVASGKRRSNGAREKLSPAPQESQQKWSALSTAERVRELERLAPVRDYTCLMHPEVHQAQEGVCPKCGMPLASVNPSVRGEYRLELSATPRSPKVGEKVHLRFRVFDPRTGQPVKRFVLNHEKLFHLFLVSRDLSDYQHIHPQLQVDGSFIVETALSRPGLYKVHSDFFPVDGTPQVIARELSTAGRRRASEGPPHLTPDETLSKTIEEMNIKLSVGNGGPLTAGLFVPLKYSLTDARTGEPVRDLEPYLGAWGHTLILNADQSEYLHSHPTEMLPGGEELAKMRGGPDVEFGAMFPEAGLYRIWTQFQRRGSIVTVSFTVRVLPETRASNP